MIIRTAMWFLVKFDEVIHAIENPIRVHLNQYNQAGVLWTVVDTKGHSPLLYFIDKRTSDPEYTQANFVKHVQALASVDPIQTEIGFRQGALQLLRNKDFMLLKALFDHYAILKPFIPNSDDPDKFRSLYAQILEGLSQFNARKVLSNKSRADQPSVLDSLFGELEKAAFHTVAMRAGLIAALENDTEKKLAIVKKILRYAHQQDNIIPLLQGATDNENVFVLLKKEKWCGLSY